MGIIHLILGKANPERMNGVNKVVYNIATKQAENNWDVEVWGISKNTEINYPERLFSTRIFKKKKNPFSIPDDLKLEILKQDRSTIFHLHGGWIPLFSNLSLFLIKNKRKYVITPHGSYNTIAMQKNKILKKIYFELFEKKIIRNATKIHCIGESEISGLQSIFPTDKTTLIAYGFKKTAIDIIFNTQKSNIIFGFIGRLDIYTKGLDILIEGFANFSKTNPNSRLWIIGDGNEKEKLSQIINSYHIKDKIELFGSKFGTEKNVLLQQMDIFVHPSRNEGLPVSILEAADFGKPCLVTKNTNIGGFIEHYNAGISIPIPDASLLTKSFHKIFAIWKNQNQYETTCKNARKMVEEIFDWEKVLNEMKVKLYNF